MYQGSNSSTASTTSLHPRVKQALTYLDCHLEDELLRYRRAKNGTQVAPSSARAMRSGDRAKPAKSSAGDRIQLTQFVPIDSLSKQSTEQVETSEEAANDFTSGTPLVDDVLVNLAVIPEDEVNADDQAYSLDDLVNYSGLEMTNQNFATDDYLESSEELLRSLAQEEANVEYERNNIEGLLTPFGIGSMMLMLMGSGMFGYLVMNPSTFSNIGAGMTRMVSGFRGGNTAPNLPTVAANPTGSGEIPKDSPEFVDLSLNSLVAIGTQGKGISGLKVPPTIGAKIPGGLANDQSGTMPTVAVPGQMGPAPAQSAGQPSGIANNPGGVAVVGGETRSANAAPASNPRPSLYRPVQPQRSNPPAQRSAPRAVNTTPLDTPPPPSAPTPIAPVAESVPAQTQGGYRVEMPYTGDTALEKAQQSDSGAYFKNGENGAVIQMGETFSSKEAAEAKAQQLKQQGFEGVEVQR